MNPAVANKSIKITAVANGYTVEMPENESEMSRLMKDVTDRMQEAMQAADGEGWKDLVPDIELPILPIEQKVFIFKTFPEVISFLQETIPLN